MNRREFVKKTAIGAAFLAVAAAADALIEPYRIRIKKYDLASPKWPKDRPPLKIAIVTDLHVGSPSVSLETVDRICKRLNDMKPDIILLLGDYLTSKQEKGQVVGGEYVEPELIAERLGALKAPLGVYSVLGNHDWDCDGQGMWQALEKHGIKVLENDAIHINKNGYSFWLAGLADDTTRKPSMKDTFARVTNGDPVIMMTHDPGTFLDRNGKPVVTLAGHTHGGQVSLPLVGAPVRAIGRSPRSYAYGHIVEGGEDLIVSSGVGTSWLPIRFGDNARPELVNLTIRPAP